ncbi:MAG: hypothetical protein LBK63_02525 [Treponema sp.]|jgi:hypothetical protein|nr:hypothetical protein [Treponema sp.]
MGGSGKGGNNRRGFRQKEKDRWGKEAKKKGPRFDKSREAMAGRPKWVPPIMSVEPIPVPDCPYCGKPIKDISIALTDKNTGEAIHFDCALRRLAENETLEQGDTVTYIGGGRFGVVRFANPGAHRHFTIKKIFEWEDKENRAEWRKSLADHYSVT